MMRRAAAARTIATFAVAALAVAACAGAGTPGGPPGTAPLGAWRGSEFRDFVDAMVTAPAFRNAHWGVLIVDPVSGDTLYSHNAGKLFMPASNQKLLTGATALVQLGADYRFSTKFAGTGPVTAGVLAGDLVVVPSGDPTFADTIWQGDHRNAFRAMADSLAARGVRQVTGALVRGGTPFPDNPCGFGWEIDDLDEPYGACVQDLFVNEGFARVMRRRSAGDSTWVARSIAIRDPRGAFWAALRTAMTERGITVAGGVDTMRVATTEGLTPIFEMRSPPLSRILAQMMKPSQNQVAELLFKTVGRERTGVGSADSARRVIERQLKEWGIDSTDHAVRDGSGMSRHDYITPAALVRLLDAMRVHASFATWYASLPIAAVDGTIGSRMRNSAAAGNVHAKTGTVDKARSLSGYVTTADKRMLIFSFLCNNFTVPTRDVERVQDAILVALAERPKPRR